MGKMQVKMRNSFLDFYYDSDEIRPRTRSASAGPAFRSLVPKAAKDEDALTDSTCSDASPLSSLNSSGSEASFSLEVCEGVGSPECHSLVEEADLDVLDIQGPITTIMIRNIPCRFRQRDLEQALRKYGLGQFDFVYIPRASLRAKSSLGYAFVNFPHPDLAAACTRTLEGLPLDPASRSHKACAVAPARIQGLQALTELANRRFRSRNKDACKQRQRCT
jgi:RNA recognition motif-containing protein